MQFLFMVVEANEFAMDPPDLELFQILSLSFPCNPQLRWPLPGHCFQFVSFSSVCYHTITNMLANTNREIKLLKHASTKEFFKKRAIARRDPM